MKLLQFCLELQSVNNSVQPGERFPSSVTVLLCSGESHYSWALAKVSHDKPHPRDLLGRKLSGGWLPLVRNSSKLNRAQTLCRFLGGRRIFQGWLGIGRFLGSDSGASSGTGGILISGIGGIPQPDSRASSRISVISSCCPGVKSGVFPWPKSQV